MRDENIEIYWAPPRRGRNDKNNTLKVKRPVLFHQLGFKKKQKKNYKITVRSNKFESIGDNAAVNTLPTQ